MDIMKRAQISLLSLMLFTGCTQEQADPQPASSVTSAQTEIAQATEAASAPEAPPAPSVVSSAEIMRPLPTMEFKQITPAALAVPFESDLSFLSPEEMERISSDFAAYVGQHYLQTIPKINQAADNNQELIRIALDSYADLEAYLTGLDPRVGNVVSRKLNEVHTNEQQLAVFNQLLLRHGFILIGAFDQHGAQFLELNRFTPYQAQIQLPGQDDVHTSNLLVLSAVASPEQDSSPTSYTQHDSRLALVDLREATRWLTAPADRDTFIMIADDMRETDPSFPTPQEILDNPRSTRNALEHEALHPYITEKITGKKFPYKDRTTYLAFTDKGVRLSNGNVLKLDQPVKSLNFDEMMAVGFQLANTSEDTIYFNKMSLQVWLLESAGRPGDPNDIYALTCKLISQVLFGADYMIQVPHEETSAIMANLSVSDMQTLGRELYSVGAYFAENARKVY